MVSHDRARQLERIARYETMMDEAQYLLSLGEHDTETLDRLHELTDALAAYYASDDWKNDYADDEKGLLPYDLRRGVLSEDGIYNLLEAYADLPHDAEPDEDDLMKSE